jgi:ketosteroid isomerase-like protein
MRVWPPPRHPARATVPDMDVRPIVEEYLAALSAADPDRVAAAVSDDFHNEQTSALGGGCRGKEAYRARLPDFLAQFAGLQYEVVDTIVEGDRAAVRYRLTANFQGHPLDIPGVMVFVVRDGLIARRTDVWDSLTFLRQTGAVTEL